MSLSKFLTWRSSQANTELLMVSEKLMFFEKSFSKIPIKNCRKMASLFLSKEKSVEEIRKHLVQFSGGSVNLLKRDDGLAIVTLQHEEKKNAMSGKMMVDFYDVVEELDSWTTGKGILVKGSGGNFCSGGDLDFVKKSATAEQGFMMSSFMQKILNKFQRLPMVSVALVEGIGALGGGSELCITCDFVLMSETCKGIGFVHAKMGIVPAWGGTNRLLEKVGYTKALEILTMAKLLTPQECLNTGLVQEIIPVNEDPENYSLSWLQKRTKFDTEVIRCLKTSLSTARDFPRDYEKERRLFAPFWGGQAHKEALLQNIKHKPET